MQGTAPDGLHSLVSVLARISLLRSGRTSETLHELPDQQRDSDQKQIRNESTYNHHMGAELAKVADQAHSRIFELQQEEEPETES